MPLAYDSFLRDLALGLQVVLWDRSQEGSNAENLVLLLVRSSCAFSEYP